MAKHSTFNEGIVFGGEPLMLEKAFLESVCQLENVKSISTNLLLLEDDHLRIFKDNNIDVATSWNPTRFTKCQLASWFSNIRKAKTYGLRLTVLVTLTDDLLSSTDSILSVLDYLNQIGQMTIKFEPYVPSSIQLISSADKWLTSFSRRWRWPNLENEILVRYSNGNILNCRDTWSLYPDGTLQNSCPTGKERVILSECYHCKYANVCKPCIKQKTCSFFKDLYEYARSASIGKSTFLAK